MEERISGGGAEEGGDGDALMAAGEGVGGVDVGIAGGAEGGSVGFADDDGGGSLTDLAEPSASVAGGQAVGAVNGGIAGAAEEGSVGAAVEDSGGEAAGVAGLRGRGGGRARGAATRHRVHSDGRSSSAPGPLIFRFYWFYCGILDSPNLLLARALSSLLVGGIDIQ